MTNTAVADSRQPSAGRVEVQVVDCDAHATPILEELIEHVPEPWRTRYFVRHAQEVEMHAAVNLPPHGRLGRDDAIPPGGTRPGTDPDFLSQQLLRDAGVDICVLSGVAPRPKVADPDFDAALCAAHNSWLDAIWLTAGNAHQRFRGSIRIDPYDPERAVHEIQRWADHPHMIQVLVWPEASALFGQRRFHPIFAICDQLGLPFAMHLNRAPGARLCTPVGFASYHAEVWAAWPLFVQSHLTSMIFEGVFERFPRLKVALVEAGFSWIGPLMWRLDRHWRALGGPTQEVPRAPSEYIRERVRLTTQPIEEPPGAGALSAVLQWFAAGRMLMLSSDYPHHDYDDPAWTLRRMPPPDRARIAAGNAIEFYGLPAERPTGPLDAAVAESNER